MSEAPEGKSAVQAVGEEEVDEKPRRFSQEQYDMLMRCSEKKDLTQWNEWRKANPEAEVLLEGADFDCEAHLADARLYGAHLEHADLNCVNLEGATLAHAHLEGAKLYQTLLTTASFAGAHLEDASLVDSELQNTNFSNASLERASLSMSNLQGACLGGARLRDAALDDTDLRGTWLAEAHIEGAKFSFAVVDALTDLRRCDCDGKTDFTGVALRSARVEPELRAALEANVRRLKWKRWYTRHRFLKWPARLFWAFSDYGTSARRLILFFFAFAAAFAVAYWLWPDMVHGLAEQEGVAAPPAILPLRALYFSVVTMTTLGFGDIHAAIGSVPGHVLLMLQVMLGYILLGALVTRFAIMFQES